MTAFYNELDPLKAAVIREAIADGAIAPGVVDERSMAAFADIPVRGSQHWIEKAGMELTRRSVAESLSRTEENLREYQELRNRW